MSVKFTFSGADKMDRMKCASGEPVQKRLREISAVSDEGPDYE